MEASGLWVIVLALGAGMWLARDTRLPKDGVRVVNAFVLLVPLPAMILVKMHALFRTPQVLSSAWVPASMAWIQFGMAALTVWLLRRPFGLGRGSQGALILTAGLGNTAFVGYPLIEALCGPEALPIAVLADQPGSFLVFSSLGVWTAASFAHSAPSWKATLKKTLLFPPAIAFFLALASAPFEFPPMVEGALEKLAASLVPTALVSVGMQLRFQREVFLRHWKPLSYGLFFKLLAMPAFMWALYVGLLGQEGLVPKVAILQSGMASMVTAAVLAKESGLDEELASLMVGIGVALSLITVPLWSLIV